MIKVKNIREGIYLLDYETQVELTTAMLRFQEHYESPEFKGKIFTLGQYREWYAEKHGGFTYYTDWNGFNFPSYVLDPFRKGLFDPLTEEEKDVLSIIPGSMKKYYVIGTHGGGNEEVLEHELCHGMYYTNEAYGKEAKTIVEKYDKELKYVKNYLVLKGYHASVLADECHAYVGVNSEHLEEQGVEYPPMLRDALIDIRERYGV